MKTVQIANVAVASLEDLNAVSTADLLAFYNDATGKSTSKFASRVKGLTQAWALIEPMLNSMPDQPSEEAREKLTTAMEEANKVFEELPFKPQEEAPAPAPSAKKEGKTRGFRFKFQKRDEIKSVKAGSKRAALLAALQAPGGATFEECMAVTGWNRKDCYEAIRLLHYYVGYGLNQDDQTGKIWVVG